MERIKNLISPRARRKKLDLVSGGGGDGVMSSTVSSSVLPTPKTFGVSLAQLMDRAPANATVPTVVSRICEYLYRYGLDNVGLFRVSGNVRIVERMRMQFELVGDVNFEEENDTAAVAGLLRVFLRDLPDTLVPAGLTKHFFSIVQESSTDTELILPEIKRALNMLPEENYNVLKYICSLLVVVDEHKDENKMSSYALAIVFGPNIFKYELTSGVDGLRDMDSSKDVMQLFITEYDTLFLEDGDLSPKMFWETCNSKKSPPPRPPPPKVQSLPLFSTLSSVEMTPASLTSSASSSSLDYRPVPSPRKIKNIYEVNTLPESEDRQTPTLGVHNSVPLFSPREDIDHSRAHSPFALESETHSIIESPMITARTNEFVEKTIVETISEHIFGGMDFNQSSGPHTPRSPQKAAVDAIDFTDGTSVDHPVVKPRTSMMSRPGPSSSAAHSSQHPEDGYQGKVLRDFDKIERSDMLTGHKKPSGPPRRSPSRKHRRSWESEESSEHSESLPETAILVSNGNFQMHSGNRSSNNHLSLDNSMEEYGRDMEDLHNLDSPTIRAKSMRRNDNQALVLNGLGARDGAGSPPQGNEATGLVDKSPSNGIKLFIPPLDLTTLHEHVDGAEPIPVTKGQLDPQKWMTNNQLGATEGDNVAVISPRSNKLKKRNGGWDTELTVEADSVVMEAPMSPSAAFGSSSYFRASVNTDIPPSPPVHQDLYKKHSDDDCSHRLRQLTKKIQGLKKKIKHFEEGFEKDHGYRPSQGEKAAQPDIKKYMNELSKARKDLKRLKEDTEKGNRSRHNSGASSSGVELSPPATPSVSNTLEFILKCLKEKRRDSGRPEEVLLMSREQVHDEKLAVQRALLHFEGLHGRPCTRDEKDLMRPLYDRYRSIKRILARPVSPRNSLELQTVPEDQMIEIPVTYPRNTIHIPTADPDEDGPSTPDFGTSDFGLVTRDLTVLRDLGFPQQRSSYSNVNDEGMQQPGGGGGGGSEEAEDSGGDAHLHELSLSELHVEIESSRVQKKKLRRCLKEFEESFVERNGRKVQKEDRHPLHKEYSEYKKVKARLRLMEALVLKHQE
ncbi:protein FAM13B [Aplysia californica]|uniref:Protein FAM13B n=1 Tax=Aplysia californica TaxID=6500 RepID=A0ABM1A8Z1_APLCA|nr:protein FAM13B [Aplysia californica]